MRMHLKWIKKSTSVLIISVLFGILGLTGCAANPKTEFENCIKEEGKSNPNYYAVQLKCSNKTGYSP